MMIEHAQGCLLGQLAGDALGSLVEFCSDEEIRKSYPNGVRDLADGGTYNTIAGQPTTDQPGIIEVAISTLPVQLESLRREAGWTLKELGIQWRIEAASKSNFDDFLKRHNVKSALQDAEHITTEVTYETKDTSLIYCVSRKNDLASQYKQWPVVSIIRAICPLCQRIGKNIADVLVIANRQINAFENQYGSRTQLLAVIKLGEFLGECFAHRIFERLFDVFRGAKCH